MDAIGFIKVALKDYKVGALTVSSKYSVEHVIRSMKPSCKFVVEYGAGEGVITKELLRRLPYDGKLVAVEINKSFLPELKKINDRRLIIANNDVLEISKTLTKLDMPRIDAVVSGIPFSLIPVNHREIIIGNTHAALTQGGQFLVYQYSPIILPMLKKRFNNVDLQLELRNLPPYFIMVAEK